MSLRVGDIIKCKVIGIQNYGAFVELMNDYTGLIHISEISNKFVSSITDYITINEIIYAKIIEIDKNNKRVKLTIKNINYRGNNNKKVIVKETPNGFNGLRKAMPLFIYSKLKEYILHEKA